MAAAILSQLLPKALSSSCRPCCNAHRNEEVLVVETSIWKKEPTAGEDAFPEPDEDDGPQLSEPMDELGMQDLEEAAELEEAERAWESEVKALVKLLRARGEPALLSIRQRLRYEFSVQKMVWESCALSRGARHLGLVAAVQSKVELGIDASEKDYARSVEILQAAQKTATEEGGIFNTKMDEMVGRMIIALRSVAPRVRLLKVIENEDAAGASPEQLEACLQDCALRSPELERRLRRVLEVLASGEEESQCAEPQ